MKKHAKNKGHGFYQTIANSLLGGEKLRDGELHVPQLVRENGKIKIKNSNFSGPGTHVVDRIKEGKRGITIQDKAANAHDIRYTLANNHQDVREADNKMIKKLLKETTFQNPIESVNNLIGAAGIGGKVLLEKLGLVNPESFASSGGHELLKEDDKKLLQTRLQELENEGYGNHKTVKKWKKHMKAYGFWDTALEYGKKALNLHQHLKDAKYANKIKNLPFVGSAIQTVPYLGQAVNFLSDVGYGQKNLHQKNF